jgi:uncharacterized membrane protein
MISLVDKQDKLADFYFIAAIILTSIFITFFSALNIVKFRIFSTTSFGWIYPNMYEKLSSLNNPFSLFLLPEFNILLILAPVNYLIAFIYRLFPYPQALLVFQVFIVASGAIPVYLLALTKLKHNYLAFAFFLAYLLHPVISTGALLGYLPLSMGLPFLLWAFYYLERGSFRKFVLFIILANSTKIDVVLMNLIFGSVLFFSKDKKEYGRIIFKISVIWLVIAALFCFFYLKFINEQFPAGLLHCDNYGNGLSAAFEYARHNFIPIFKNLFNEKNMLLTLLVFLPNSIAFCAPFFLLPVFPEIIYILIRNQHSSGHFLILAFVFLASIYGTDNLIWFCARLFGRANLKAYLSRIISFLIASFALFNHYYIPPKTDFGSRLGPLPLSAKFDADFYNYSRHAQIGEKIIKMIPEKTNCLTLQSIGFRLGKCENVGVFTRYVIAAHIQWEYIFLDLFKDDFYQISKKDYFLTLKEFILKDNYGVMYFEDGWLLLKRDHSGKANNPVLAAIDNFLKDEK